MPHKQKIAPEEKVRLVQKCINGEISRTEGRRMAGVEKSTFLSWIKRYESEGAAGFETGEKNRVYDEKLKRRAVEEYLAGVLGQRDICKKYKIRARSRLQAWVKVYNAHEDFNSRKRSGGGSYMKQARSTTQEERLQIVKDCLESGKNYGEMALKYNVSYQQVRTWTLKFEELGETGLEDRRGKRKKDQEPRTELEAAQIEIERLRHQLYLAEMENRLLKKLDEIVRRDASDK